MRFKQLQLSREGDMKLHYKPFKAGKQWINAPIGKLAMVISAVLFTVGLSDVSAHTDSTSSFSASSAADAAKKVSQSAASAVSSVSANKTSSAASSSSQTPKAVKMPASSSPKTDDASSVADSVSKSS